MIPLHVNKIKKVQNSFQSDINAHRLSALQKLQAIDRNLFDANEQAYLNTIITKFNDVNFLIKTPSEIEALKQEIGDLPPISRFVFVNVNGQQTAQAQKKQLTHYIQDALDYKGLRNNFYPKYFRKIGIKTCVYCNSQLTVTIAKKGKIIDARFEVDHHNPKADYPYLSISLFNLYPCCSSCNKRKSTKPINFKLYTDDISKLSKSEFSFKISKSSKCSYLVTKDIESIQILFNDTSTPVIGHESLQNRFNIKEIHETQKDIIAELIIKNQTYNDSLKDTLRKSFSKLSLSENDFDRVIVGNYTREKDIHKRPFSKMTMDIAKQLGLIK